MSLPSNTSFSASSRSTKVSSGFMRTLGTRWLSLAARERLAVTVALWVLALGLLWWLGLAPALQTLRAADTQRVALERQHQTMLGLQAQARALQGQTKLASGESTRALEASVKQGLGTGAQLNVAGERATVTVKGVTGDALAQWLAQVRANAHALPTEAKLTRTASAGSNGVNGTNGSSGSTGATAAGSSNAPSTATAAAVPPAVTWDGSIVLRLP